MAEFGGRRPVEPIIDAFKLILENESLKPFASKWRLLVAAASSDSQPYKINDHFVKKYIHFAGRIPGLEHALRQSDLFITASHFEGMSISLLEAMACGLPLISTGVDGITDVLEDMDKSDWEAIVKIVPHENSRTHIANAWKEVMQTSNEINSESSKSLSCHVRQHFTTDVMLEKYISLYHKYLAV